ncbi:MAG: hypothetical protein HQK49_21645 [Oligoflexia bacterium]|nr:hypothetical protein [Oligoflexia bacterium]
MNNLIKFLFVTSFFVNLLFINFFLSGTLSAETVYVRSLKAKLLSEPKHGSQEIAELSRDTLLNLKEKNSGWALVEYQKQNGWLPTMLITSTPSKDNDKNKAGILSGNNDVDLSQNARRRASAFTEAAAARGLQESSSDFFKNLNGENYQALKNMESYQMSEEMGQKFLSILKE